MYFRVLAVLCLFIVSFGLVSAIPSPDDVVARQAPSLTVPAGLSAPTSITTNRTIQTANGNMTETCVITLTPDGSQIQEVQNCTTAMGANQVTTTLVAAPSSTPTAMVAAAAFVMPGTTMQVLPVGISIYGAITAIMVGVIAAGTWGRVQCRKQYREQQRMAESTFARYAMSKW